MVMKKYLNSFLFLFISIILIFLSIFMLQKNSKFIIQRKMAYEEKSNIDYKVYLHENEFFKEPYLDKGKVYITNLIDYLDINFNYSSNYQEPVNGKIKYYIKGIVSANIVDSDKEYWKEEFIISKPKEINVSNNNSMSFSTNVEVNYQEYNDILLKFIKKFGLAIDGKLEIELIVESKLSSLDDIGSFSNVSNTSLEIPLTQATIEVPIKLNEVDKESEIDGVIDQEVKDAYIHNKNLCFVIFITGSLFMVMGIVYFVKNLNKKSKYVKKRDKILKTYDSIIVNSKFDIDINDYNVIKVNKFEELLDAYMEVRQPINFYEENDKSIFILINNKILWIYVLKNKD